VKRRLLRLNSERRRAFTLIELLVVIGIIAALLVAVVPAVNTLSKSSGRKATASLLLGVIEQARAQAIKDGRATYVVFAAQPVGSVTGVTDQKIIDRYFYHSAAIFEDDPDPTQPKVQLTPWKLFPAGISLRTEISFAAPPPPPVPINNANWSSGSFAFTPAGSQLQSFPYMEFDQTGMLVAPTPVDPAQPMRLRFFEGLVTGTFEKPTTQANKDEAISIADTTGRATYVP
jgi:prepilin-type N-terminal cleavage/methylation domain-containing protein